MDDNVSQIPSEPHHFIKHFFGEKYVVLSIVNGETMYAIGAVDSIELAYLSRILDIISQDKIKGGLE